MNLSSGTQSLIAGALVDFVAHLTTLPKTIKAGASEEVYDVRDELLRWADSRGMPLERVEAKMDWDKTASVVTLEMLASGGQDGPERIAGALASYVDFVRATEATNYEEAFVKWATKTGLEIHDPQLRWAAHWWL
jgi:hypothetical protein